MMKQLGLTLLLVLFSGCTTPPPEIKSTDLQIVSDPAIESAMQKLITEFRQSPYSSDQHSVVNPVLSLKTAWETLEGFKKGTLQPDFLVTPGEAFTRALNVFSGSLSSKYDTCTPLGSLPMSIAMKSPMKLDALPDSFSLSAESPKKSSEGFFALNQRTHIQRYLDIRTSPLSLITTDGILTSKKNLDALKARITGFSKKYPESINNVSSIPFVLCRATGGTRTKDRLIASGRFSTFFEQKLPTLTPEFFELDPYKDENTLKETDIISTFNNFASLSRTLHFLVDASGSMAEEKRFSQVIDISRVIENQKKTGEANSLSLFSTEFSELNHIEKSISDELTRVQPKGDFLIEDALKKFFTSLSKLPQSKDQKDLIIITDGTGIKSLSGIIPIFEQMSTLPQTHTFLVILNQEMLPILSPIERIPFVTLLGYDTALQVFRGL